jgi:hypothetical protein
VNCEISERSWNAGFLCESEKEVINKKIRNGELADEDKDQT